MRAFIDTSSLFKKYVEEDGSRALDRLLQGISEIVVSPVTWIEMNAAIARRLRERSLARKDAAWLKAEARRDFQSFHRVVWNETLETTATDLVSHYPLSTLDAIQLASGILSKADVFVTSDHVLFENASREVRRAVRV